MFIDYSFDDEENYTYEVDYDELKKAIVKILCNNAHCVNGKLFEPNGAYQVAMYVVYNLDLVDSLSENLEDELREFFEDKAYEKYKSALEDEKEQEDWYGTMNDVRGV